MAEFVPFSEQAEKKRETKILLEEFYRPSRDIQEAIFDVYEKFIRWRSLREQDYKQFNGKQAIDWWEESREKFWGYLPLSYDLDVPQFFFPETRNQVIAILSKISNLRMKPRFEGVENFDIVKSTVLKDLFEYWRRSSNKKIKNFWAFLYAVINGTSVVFVGYRSKKRTVKDITMFDPATGETEWEDRDDEESEVTEILCNLEDIYIPKLWEPNIQEQEEIIWRTLMKWSDFKNAFSGYELADYVFPGMQFADQSIFSQFLAYDVRGSDFVEVIRYFNKPKDRYMLIANGVLLNPMKQKGKKDEILSPLPWNHKQLPFAKTIFEPLDSSFFYGMSLPQKVKTPQDALNQMWELMLERERRSVSSPIITNDPNIQLGLEFKPGRIYQVGTDVNQYKELQVAPTTSSFWNVLNNLQGIVNRTGSGGLAATVQGKQPRSATEKAAEANREKENTGLYYMFYEDLMEQVAWLVVQNMIQFYTAEKTNKILGERKFHKILNMIDVQLAQGGNGNRYIRITDTPAPENELRQEAWYRSMFHKERAEIVEVSPKMLRQLKFDIKIDFEPDDSPTNERALFIDFTNMLMDRFGQPSAVDPQTGQASEPPLIDKKKILFRLVEKFGENIADYIPDQLVQEYEQERFGMPAQQSQTAMPEVNKANQSLIGQENGAQGPAEAIGASMGQTPLPGKQRPEPVYPEI